MSAAALVLSALMFLTGCGASVAASDPGAESGPEASLPARDAGDLSGGEPAKAPRKPEPGKWYPHDFNSHCGLHSTEFAGRTWLVRTVRTDLPSPVEQGGQALGQNVLAGYIQLASPDVAVFASAELPPVELQPGETDSTCM
ncbi:hypothetical protein G6045_24750 [Streptomyces sp. YC504]|uniref:Uncharacterized protein n=1 Tax=Streptomyces mesophilus TaxID=1775132 RepID=A0A6G4XQF7_9ACTN|nr:hypothetical protein [Streptomyces mesophilus]NGO78841.1 hypothetical protein [Streptomyces mesophilus]